MGLLNTIAYYIADNLKNGSTLVSKEVAEKRKDICYGRNGHDKCDYLVENGDMSKCGKCECFIEVKAASETHLLEGLKKGKLKREKVTCPMNYWEDYFANLEIKQTNEH